MNITLAEASVIYMIRTFDVFAYLGGTDRQNTSYTLSYTYEVFSALRRLLALSILYGSFKV